LFSFASIRTSAVPIIFVANAFGSFRGGLREGSYSPLMAPYLTSLENKAYHIKGTFPDENYAREVMQLFTIGLEQRNHDFTLPL